MKFGDILRFKTTAHSPTPWIAMYLCAALRGPRDPADIFWAVTIGENKDVSAIDDMYLPGTPFKWTWGRIGWVKVE